MYPIRSNCKSMAIRGIAVCLSVAACSAQSMKQSSMPKALVTAVRICLCWIQGQATLSSADVRHINASQSSVKKATHVKNKKKKRFALLAISYSRASGFAARCGIL
jgi:hypothetical protein